MFFLPPPRPLNYLVASGYGGPTLVVQASGWTPGGHVAVPLALLQLLLLPPAHQKKSLHPA